MDPPIVTPDSRSFSKNKKPQRGSQMVTEGVTEGHRGSQRVTEGVTEGDTEWVTEGVR